MEISDKKWPRPGALSAQAQAKLAILNCNSNFIVKDFYAPGHLKVTRLLAMSVTGLREPPPLFMNGRTRWNSVYRANAFPVWHWVFLSPALRV
jgi:hypothetical protein